MLFSIKQAYCMSDSFADISMLLSSPSSSIENISKIILACMDIVSERTSYLFFCLDI